MSSGLRDEFSPILSARKMLNAPPAAALDNFARVFAIRPEDRVLMLLDRKIDPRVPAFIAEFARGRGASVQALTVEHSWNGAGACAIDWNVPDFVRPLAEWATFVVSTWFSSVINPFFINLRRERGQRWVKITFFRNLDLLSSEAAAFPLEVIGLLIRKTAERIPKREVTFRVTDSRGTDLRIKLTGSMVTKLLAKNYFKGHVTAAEDGNYVHYIPTHGPNFFDNALVDGFFGKDMVLNGVYEGIEGVIIPQWSVGFPEPFRSKIAIEIRNNIVQSVTGDDENASILREALKGGAFTELGCGFNPKWPRDQIYPAGSNSPGSLHFGFDLPKESLFFRKVLPDWPEPRVHADLTSSDATVHIDDELLIDQGFLTTLRDPEVVAAAARYGDPVYLLENWPTLGELRSKP